LGRRLGELARAGDVILLVGELGAGKTCLTQGIAWGLGIEDYTLSPSFVILREYRGRLPLYHIDLYRLERVEEVMDLGLEDYFYGQGLSVVEWADRGLGALPEEHLLIALSHLSETQRRLHLEARGGRSQELLEGLGRRA
jgi:tRNA threonylcarbamoyladenosine biosynthesis protein TsaE